ncbi:hypothetical protein ZWY2020_058056 [Hordeum vulgare]|nr:hypothetical protein ZWY2020_058056 [Hordeum vulgare]
MAPTPPTPAPPPRRVLRGAAPRKSCKAWLLQSIPTEMPHLHRLPVVLSIGTDRLPPLYLPYSRSSSSSPRCGERRRPRAPRKSCKAWLLQSIPTEMPHLHRLPVVLSIASIKSWCLLLGLGTTYSELLDTLVNYAKSVRVEKGDAVVIYLPMLMELPIAMLACSRIGPVHSVVFLASPPMQ